jgi:hypothetical protein
MSPDTVFEPNIALFGGPRTGFELYERLFRQIRHIENTTKVTLCIEFGYDQKDIATYIVSAL